jgi:hypothetical protein
MTPADMRAEALADGEAAALEAMRTWRLIAQEAFHRLAEQQREIERLRRQIAEMQGGRAFMLRIFEDTIAHDFAHMEES